MTDLNRLYNDMILALADDTNNGRPLPPPYVEGTARNRLCGDQTTILARITPGGTVADAAHDTRGCVLCSASARLLIVSMRGAGWQEVEEGRRAVEDLILRGTPVRPSRWSPFEIFSPLTDFTARHDCVRLPFQAFAEAVLSHRMPGEVRG